MKKIIYSAIALLLLGVGYVGYYLVSPFFITIKLDEAIPTDIISQNIEITQNQVNSETPTATQVNPSQTLVVTPHSTEVEPVKKEEPIFLPAAAVVGTPGHTAQGTARLLSTSQGNTIRYENFRTTNGPDLFVYLSTDLEATNFVNLGRLKATEGNVNYSIPADVDIKQYPYVLVWCKQFGVLFNSAKIQ